MGIGVREIMKERNSETGESEEGEWEERRDSMRETEREKGWGRGGLMS